MSNEKPFTDTQEIEMKRIAKEAYKEAYKEWLSEKLAEVGVWSLRTLAVLAIVALLYFILTMHGWKGPPAT